MLKRLNREEDIALYWQCQSLTFPYFLEYSCNFEAVKVCQLHVQTDDTMGRTKTLTSMSINFSVEVLTSN